MVPKNKLFYYLITYVLLISTCAPLYCMDPLLCADDIKSTAALDTKQTIKNIDHLMYLASAHNAAHLASIDAVHQLRALLDQYPGTISKIDNNMHVIVPASPEAKSLQLRYAHITSLPISHLTKDIPLPAPNTIETTLCTENKELKYLGMLLTCKTLSIINFRHEIACKKITQLIIPSYDAIEALQKTAPINKKTEPALTLLKTIKELVADYEYTDSLHKQLKTDRASENITKLAKILPFLSKDYYPNIPPIERAKIDITAQKILNKIVKEELIPEARASGVTSPSEIKTLVLHPTKLIEDLCGCIPTERNNFALHQFITKIDSIAQNYIKRKNTRTMIPLFSALYPDATDEHDAFSHTIPVLPEISGSAAELKEACEKTINDWQTIKEQKLLQELGEPACAPKTQKSRTKKTAHMVTPIIPTRTTTPGPAESAACKEETGEEELLAFFGPREVSADHVAEIELPINPHLPHSDGSYLTNIDKYTITIQDPYNNCTIRLFRIDEHSASPVHHTYAERIYQWFNEPEKALQIYEKKALSAHTPFNKEKNLLIHRFARRVDSFLPILGNKTTWDGQKPGDTVLTMAGEIEDAHKTTKQGIFVFTIDKNGTCYHRNFTQHPWNEILSSRIEQGFKLAHPDESDSE